MWAVRSDLGFGPRLLRQLSRCFEIGGKKLQTPPSPNGVWIDVGAHLGENSFLSAKRHSSLMVYAFEPNLKLAAQRMGLLANFVVIPMAVAETDGSSDFYLNSFDNSSSLLPLDSEGLRLWIGGELLSVQRKVTVPTIRLDTFMNGAGISRVEFLKIDTQGVDFEVVKSAGDRLADIERITLEVSITDVPLYAGACNKEEVVDYLTGHGFDLVDCEKQSYGQEENLTFTRRQSKEKATQASEPFDASARVRH